MSEIKMDLNVSPRPGIDVNINVGGGADISETDPTVPDWAKQPEKPTYTAADVGALPVDTHIPSKTSDLANDSGYITRAVDDLANYYLRSETYTRDEINAKISAIPKFAIKAVAALPQTDISSTTIYLLSGGDGSDLYTEYIYVDGKWEILGSQRVDLTGYATETWVSQTLQGYQQSGDYALRSEIPIVPKNVSELTNDAGYLTEHQDISGKLDAKELPAAINTALAQAKASGEFDGPQGEKGDPGEQGPQGADGSSVAVSSVSESTEDGGSNVVAFSDGKTMTVKNGRKGSDGYSPIKGIDYYTDADKAEFTEYISAELAKRGQLKPEFADSVDDCENTSLLYVLPDGYIYAYMRHEETTEGGETPNFTNMLTYSGTVVYNNKRYSKSSDAFKDLAACDSVAIPIPTSGSIFVRFRNCKYYGNPANLAYTDANLGKSTTSFTDQTVISGADNWLTDNNGDLYFAFTNTSGSTYMNVNLDTVDVASAIITVNEEITYTTVEGGTTVTYKWVSTGHAFVPADYEDRIITLEGDTSALKGAVKDIEADVEALKERPGSAAISTMIYAPSPQLPADGSETADFDANNIDANDIYAYIDALVAKYPRYLTKETLGKDASGTYDWCRYTASRRTYDAWVNPAYPAMYGWTDGSTTIYSVSVSPRVGDTMYTTAYIGMAYSTVTAVDNAAQARTVNGLVFSRDKTKDIAPTLVYTRTDYDSRRLGVYASWHNTVYDASRGSVGTIASIADGVLTDSSGNTYNRYPMGDVDSSFAKLPVLVVGSNEHGGNIGGDPAEAAIITARLIKDLCECKQADNPMINLLKTEYMIVFCPVINPWGYGKESGYVNSTGVNIDRNMDTPGWGSDTDTRHGDYGGSENETQHLMNTLYESGAKIALANHALGSHVNTNTGEAVNAGMCSYMLGRDNSKYNSHLEAIAETMAVNYDLGMYNMGQAPGDTYAKTRSYMDYIGIEGGAVEMSAIDGYLLHGGARHTAQILEADYTLLLQFLQMLIDCQEA